MIVFIFYVELVGVFVCLFFEDVVWCMFGVWVYVVEIWFVGCDYFGIMNEFDCFVGDVF